MCRAMPDARTECSTTCVHLEKHPAGRQTDRSLQRLVVKSVTCIEPVSQQLRADCSLVSAQVMFLSPFRTPCASCGAFVSPQWRCGGTLCNACGIKLSRGRLQHTDHAASAPAKSSQPTGIHPPTSSRQPPNQQLKSLQRQPAKRNRTGSQTDYLAKPRPSGRQEGQPNAATSKDPASIPYQPRVPPPAPAAAANGALVAAPSTSKQQALDLDSIAKHRSARKRTQPKWYQQYESGEEGEEQQESEESVYTEVGLAGKASLHALLYNSNIEVAPIHTYTCIWILFLFWLTSLSTQLSQ